MGEYRDAKTNSFNNCNPSEWNYRLCRRIGATDHSAKLFADLKPILVHVDAKVERYARN